MYFFNAVKFGTQEWESEEINMLLETASSGH